MKKKFIFLVASIICCLTTFGQSCLPEGIIFTSQSAVDSFQIKFPNCTEIEGSVTIAGPYNITNLNGLSVLTSIKGNLNLESNFMLINFIGLGELKAIGGNVYIYNNGLLGFSGLNKLTTIKGNFIVAQNWKLLNFKGLERLNYIGGNVTIEYNDSLVELKGLDSLKNIGGSFEVYYEDHLKDLSGLNNLDSINGDLLIHNNDSLISLNGLKNLTSISGRLNLYDNPLLESINEIDHINPKSISSIIITRNSVLGRCAIQSICEFLSNPGGTVEIHDNAPGCDNQEEVQIGCDTLGIIPNFSHKNFFIYPNPAYEKVSIININGSESFKVTIFNQIGQSVFSGNLINQAIELVSFPVGIYLIEIISQDKVYKAKLIKN